MEERENTIFSQLNEFIKFVNHFNLKNMPNLPLVAFVVTYSCNLCITVYVFEMINKPKGGGLWYVIRYHTNRTYFNSCAYSNLSTKIRGSKNLWYHPSQFLGLNCMLLQYVCNSKSRSKSCDIKLWKLNCQAMYWSTSSEFCQIKFRSVHFIMYL